MELNSIGFLYSRPTFFEGVARLIDVDGALNAYNTSTSQKEADFKAVYHDWNTIGEDFKKSFEDYVEQNNKE